MGELVGLRIATPLTCEDYQWLIDKFDGGDLVFLPFGVKIEGSAFQKKVLQLTALRCR